MTAVQHRELLKPTMNRDWIQLLAQVKRDGLAGVLAPALFLLTTILSRDVSDGSGMPGRVRQLAHSIRILITTIRTLFRHHLGLGRRCRHP